MTGVVFDIKEFTVHDGPGTRVTVFLKGCPMRCAWCHNPEGLSPEPELLVKENQCVHCGLCFKPCQHGDCRPFGRCLYVCPMGLITVSGEKWEATKLANHLMQYEPYLKGGGVTFSGGEPLIQADFVAEVCEHLPKLHKALQTSGCTELAAFKKAATAVDYVLFDLKLADSELHKKYTGVDNANILRNFEWLQSSGIEYVVRVPLISGITDTEDNFRGISKIAGSSRVELMRYNPLAGAKYPWVGREFIMPSGVDNAPVELSLFEKGSLV